MSEKQQTSLAILGGAPIRTRPWPTWPRADQNTANALLDVLHSGRWAISGAYQGNACYERRFSKAFAEYNGVRYCVPTASGTASLTLALLGLGIGPNDEVLVPGLTWVACASSVFCVGARPVLVDIEPGTLAMSLGKAIKALTPRTKAIMLVHPFCRLADIDGFVALSREQNIPLIEDCSQAHGATWRGKRVGSFGIVGCFSMQQSKVLTSGEGGAAITDDELLYERMEQLRSDGRMFGKKPRIGHLELMEIGAVQGQNFCISEFQASVLLDRLQHLDAENKARARWAENLDRALKDGQVKGAQPLAPQKEAENTYYNYVLNLDLLAFANCSIDVISRALTSEIGAPINPVYKPLNRHPLYNPLVSSRAPRSPEALLELNPKQFHLPESDKARSHCLSFMNYLLLDSSQGVHDIIAAIEKIQSQAEKLAKLPQEASADAF